MGGMLSQWGMFCRPVEVTGKKTVRELATMGSQFLDQPEVMSAEHANA
jgi:hypothetical protein